MSTSPRRVFVLDDEVIIAFEMADILEDLGFEVIGPSVHLEEAKELARAEDFDVAFLDVNLGAGKTAKPVAEILREREIPFVYITAYSPDQIDFRMPNERVLRKPVARGQILQALTSTIAKLIES